MTEEAPPAQPAVPIDVHPSIGHFARNSPLLAAYLGILIPIGLYMIVTGTPIGLLVAASIMFAEAAFVSQFIFARLSLEGQEIEHTNGVLMRTRYDRAAFTALVVDRKKRIVFEGEGGHALITLRSSVWPFNELKALAETAGIPVKNVGGVSG